MNRCYAAVAAMKVVEEGGAVRTAAREHGVPYSTLKDRLRGRVQHDTKPGPRPYLNCTEEADLGDFLKKCVWIWKDKKRCYA